MNGSLTSKEKKNQECYGCHHSLMVAKSFFFVLTFTGCSKTNQKHINQESRNPIEQTVRNGKT